MKPGEREAPTEQPATRRRQAKPNARGQLSRALILATAARHFGESGFRGASAAAIASEADLSEPGLLHHFGSKTELLMSLLEMRYSHDETKLLADRELEGLQLLPLLVTLVRENEREPEPIKLSMVLLAESISKSHPSHEFFKRRYARAREIVAAHLARARNEGFIRQDVDAESLAAVLLAAIDGLQLQWLLDSRVDMSRCFEMLVAILEGALAKPL